MSRAYAIDPETGDRIPIKGIHIFDDGGTDAGSLPYVTPEMFGAKGDGAADDTAAIQAAIDSGRNVRLMDRRYLVKGTLKTQNREFWTFDASDATIRKYGRGYVFEADGLNRCRLLFGVVSADDGGIKIENTAPAGSMYNDISFVLIQSGMGKYTDTDTACIDVDKKAGYLTELRIDGGQLGFGKRGVRLKGAGTVQISGAGFEGVEIGLELDGTVHHNDIITLMNCRHNESLRKLIYARGDNRHLKIIDGNYIKSDWIDTDNQLNDCVLNTRIANSGFTVIAQSGFIHHGVLLPQLDSGTGRCNTSSYPAGAVDLSDTSTGDVINKAYRLLRIDPQTTELKLSNMYGTRYGLNELTFFFGGTSDGFQIKDAAGAVIYKGTAEDTDYRITLRWVQEQGWYVAGRVRI